MRRYTSFLVDFFHHPGVDLLQLLPGAGQEGQIGQEGDAAGNAVREFVQAGHRALGEHRCPAAGLGQPLVEELFGIRGLPGLDLDPQVDQLT